MNMQKNSNQSEYNKKLGVKKVILYSFESIIMLFDIIMSIGVFETGSALAGFVLLLSAFLISPFCEKLFRKLPAPSFQNGTLVRVGIQILYSIILFVIGAVLLSVSTPETIETGMPVAEQTTSEKESITTTADETGSATSTTIETTTEITTTTVETTTTIPETEVTTTTIATTTTTIPEIEATTATTTILETESTTETNAETADDEDTLLSHDMIAAILQLSLQESMENSTVTYDEEEQAYVILVWQDGLALSLTVTDQSSPEWKNLKETFVNSADTLLESVKELDPDAHLYLQLLNDQNLEKTLLQIYDGVITYDVLAQ